MNIHPTMDDVGTVGLLAGEEVARRAAALAKWRRRSELVHFYRRALPMAMAGLTAMCIGWIVVRSLIAQFHKAPNVSTIHLTHPTYYGRSDDGQPYKMMASLAVQDDIDPDRVSLTEPSYAQTVAAPSLEVVSADRGIYHKKAKLLDLYGHVRATDGKDNHFESDYAHIDLNKSDVGGRVPMYAYGPSGTLRAQSYLILNKGRHMLFIGGVHSHLVTTSSGAAATRGAPAPTVAPVPVQASALRSNLLAPSAIKTSRVRPSPIKPSLRKARLGRPGPRRTVSHKPVTRKPIPHRPFLHKQGSVR